MTILQQSKTDDGGAAFPNGDLGGDVQPGMSLRDYFAGQSLAGGADSFCDAMGPHETATTEEDIAQHAERHAKAAYLLADAMLKQRKGGQS